MKKAKAKAISRVPQSREDAVWAIGRVGELRREIKRHMDVAAEAARLAGEKLERDTAELVAELAEQERGIQTWCEANRLALTQDGKVKHHDFGTGKISWRQKPPRVSIRGVEAVIEYCRRFGKLEFIRTKDEINKEAMLADPDTARAIAGVTIHSGDEDFDIVPLEIDAPNVMQARA